MKTFNCIRIGMMGMISLVVIGFTSNCFAAINAFLIFKDANGKETKVKINSDGSFQTPPLHAGIYRCSFGASQTGAQAVHDQYKGATDRSVSSGGDRPQESIHLAFTKIVITGEEKNASASGAVTGKRMHKPFSIMKQMDAASPKLMMDLSSVTVDTDGDGISGSVIAQNKAGNKMAIDDWITK